MIECFYSMDETIIIKQIADGVIYDKETVDVVSQVDEFERYLSDMKITVEKRQLIIHRDDELPRQVFYN